MSGYPPNNSTSPFAAVVPGGRQPTYPPPPSSSGSSTPKHSSVYSPSPSPSLAAFVVRSPAVFPPGTDPDAVACFHAADVKGEGIIGDVELQKGLSLYHYTISISTVRLLTFVYTNFSDTKIGPTEFVILYDSLKTWKAIFEIFDSDRSGKIEVAELGNALEALGFAVPPPVLEQLVVKYGYRGKGIEYNNFIECCLIVKGLSDKFMEKDTARCGSITITIESFLLTILPLITVDEVPTHHPPPPSSAPQPTYPPPSQPQSQYYPQSSTPTYHHPPPPRSQKSIPSSSSVYYPSHQSPFAAVVPSPAVFPPGTDANAVACFRVADQSGEGLIDDLELQKGLSLYLHTFSIRTVRLLMFVYTNFSTTTKIGPSEFVTLYNSLKTWKAIFEKFDSDRSGKIDISELGNALIEIGFVVPSLVLKLLISKFGCVSQTETAIEYDNFIECCLIVKGLSEKFKENDSTQSGSITISIESFLLTILPFIPTEQPTDSPTYPPPPKSQKSIPNSSVYPSQSPYAAVNPLPAMFPPGTDANAVACFQVADQSGERLLDDLELQKGLSLYFHTFSIRTVRLLMFVYTNFSTTTKIGPLEFVTLYNSLKTWKAIFEKFDSDRSGKIDISELGNALVELGFVVPSLVLKLLIAKFGCVSETEMAIEYDNFIECCLIVKGLSEKFKENDSMLSGSITLSIESFLLTILPFIPKEQPTDSLPSSYQPPTAAPHPTYPAHPKAESPWRPNYPPSSTPSYPPQAQSSYPPSSTPSYPPAMPSHSPFAAVVPSPVVFPPGTDANAVACFQLADQNGEGLIDDVELQKGLSLYHHTFNIHTVRLLMFVYTNFSTTTKIAHVKLGPTEFVTLYNSLKSWKATFEKFDSDRSGKIEVAELRNALASLGFAVPAKVLELLVAKYGCGCDNDKGIQYDKFIECSLIVKGLSDKFKEKDTALCGSITLTIEAFLLTILPFIFPAEPTDAPPSSKQSPQPHSSYPPSYPPQDTCPPPAQVHSPYPPPYSTPPYPPPLQKVKTTTSFSVYPPPAPSPSPFAAVVPSPVVFPPGTDANAVACFQLADQNGKGLIDDFELRKGLSLFHHTFNIHTVRLLIFVSTNFSTVTKIGPTEFVTLYNNLKTWKAAFEKFDSDRSGKIEVAELGKAFLSLGFAVPAHVLKLLEAKYGCGCETTGIEYDNFIECCLIVKGLSEKFRDKDTALCGSITLTIEAFLLTILPFIFPAEPTDSPPSSSQPPKNPPQRQSSYPLSSRPPYPPQRQSSYPSPGPSPSPFAAVVPSPVVFPPGTDANAVACFQVADQSREGIIDDFELQKGLSLYHHTFNIHTVRLLMFVYTNFSTVTKIGPTDFVTLYNNIKTWKAAFEKFDSDRSGKIDVAELGNAFISLGFAVPAQVLELLEAKYGCGTGIEYDNFIECCLIVKGLSEKFRDKDTMLCGSITLTIEAFLLTILPFIFPAEPTNPPPSSSQPPKTPPQRQSSYPPSSTPPYPPPSHNGKYTTNSSAYPPPGPSPSPFAAVVPSPVVFPPGTDLNAVACFQVADQSLEGMIDVFELQKGLSLYHHTFNIHTVRLLMFVYNNFSTVTKIGPTEFVTLYNNLKTWKAAFEKFDSDRSGKIEATELGNAFISLGFAVPAQVLEMLEATYGCGCETTGIEYDNFIECCLIVKGLSEKFRDKDTALCGSITLTIEAFLLTILPFIFPAEPTDLPPSSSQTPKTTPRRQSSYPPPSTPPYPPTSHSKKSTPNSSAYPPPGPSPSPFAAVAPSPVVFPPGTDANAVACFQVADQSGEGIIDEFELKKGLSLYHHTFNIHTVRLLVFIYTNFSTVTKIGPTEFVELYDNLTTWKAAFQKFDSDRSGKIEVAELGNAFLSLGFAVPAQVLELLEAKYGCGYETAGIEYDNFIECCLIVKGLSDKFRDKDTSLSGSVTLTIEAFVLTILPFIFPAEPTDLPPSSSQPPKTPSQGQSQSTPNSSDYPLPGPSPSPFAAVVPSPAVFPPGTDANAVACFQVADQSGEGIIDEFELHKGLSLYHHTFNIHTVRLLVFVYTNFSTVTKIGPTEFVELYNNLTTWKAAFEKFDSDRSGKIELAELGNAFLSLGFAVPAQVLELLEAKYGCGCETTGIEYDNFIECCLIVKGLSDKFRDQDTSLSGSVTLTIEAFVLTILPFIFPAEPTDLPPSSSQPPKTPPQGESQSTPNSSDYPLPGPSHSPFAAVVPSAAVFPPGTDANAVACFQVADQSGEGIIDEFELHKGLSLYHHTFNIHTVRLLVFVYSNFSTVTKIGPTEFVELYDNLTTWKAAFEKFDSDRSGKIEVAELGNAFLSLGFAVPAQVLELLEAKYGSGCETTGIEYENFIECCLIVKGLSDKFRDQDTSLSGSVTLTIEAFVLTILPFIFPAEPTDLPPSSSQPPKTPPQEELQSTPNSSDYPLPGPSPSPFAAVVPSPAVFPPGTDANAVACFQVADQSGEGIIDEFELHKGLSLYHHTFNIHTVRLLVFVYSNFSTVTKIGPTEFVELYDNLTTWKAAFEKFDSDRSGKIEVAELGNAFLSLGFAVPALVLELLEAKYGSGCETTGIEYENFIECCLIVKGLSDKFRDQDTSLSGSVTLTIEAFVLTILPFIFPAEPTDLPPSSSQPPKTPPQGESQSTPNSSDYPLPGPSPSPFAAVVPSPAVFPPGTDANAVACFQVADQSGEGIIDEFELHKGLSLYHHTFNIHTVRLLVFVYSNFSTVTKIGPTEFVELYDNLTTWKAAFEKFDSDHSGKIEVDELGNAFLSLGFAVPAQVLELLEAKYGCGVETMGIEYENFIVCCLIVKGLSDKFRDKDTSLSGSVSLTIEAFVLTILPFIFPAEPTDLPPSSSQPPKIPLERQSSYPPSSTPPSPPLPHSGTSTPNSSAYPPPGPSPSQLAIEVPSPVVFPPDTDANAVACLQVADQSGETPLERQSSYPPSSTPPSPPPPHSGTSTPNSSAYPPPGPSPSQFATDVPSPVVFPPDIDANAVACFQVADQSGEGVIDDEGLQKGLALYHHTFSLHTVHMIMFVYSDSSTVSQIGSTEFVTVYNSLETWKPVFEQFDTDRSGKIDATELGNALLSLGFAVPSPVLELLVERFGCGDGTDKGIEYENFIECCLIAKGISAKFQEKDTKGDGTTVTFEYESYLLTILPFATI